MTAEVLEPINDIEIPAQTSVELTEGVEVELINPYEGRMLPHQGGLHVPDVARYESGFRSYRNLK